MNKLIYLSGLDASSITTLKPLTWTLSLVPGKATSNKVTSISSSSTDTEYPSAKAVYDYIQSLDGDEVSY